MDRAEFLKWRVDDLKQSIALNEKVLALYERYPDVDDDKRDADIKEIKRRIELDSKLLAGRQMELSDLVNGD